MIKKIISFAVCMVILIQTAFAASVSEFYVMEYSGDRDWRKEDLSKFKVNNNITYRYYPFFHFH